MILIVGLWILVLVVMDNFGFGSEFYVDGFYFYFDE